MSYVSYVSTGARSAKQQLFIRPLVALGICLSLTGCPRGIIPVKKVYVPVYAQCVKEVPSQPVLRFEHEQGDIYAQVKALLEDRIDLQEYAVDLNVVIDGCRTEPKISP